jgi:hypothetical protein
LEIRNYVSLADYVFPEFRCPGINLNSYRDKRVKLFNTWVQQCCPHRAGFLLSIDLKDIPGLYRLFDFLEERIFDLDGIYTPYIPALEKRHPYNHDEYDAKDAPYLLDDLESLKFPVDSNSIVSIHSLPGDYTIEFTHKSKPRIIGYGDEHMIGIGPDGFFISENDDSWFWEYEDLKILFTSKSFTCNGFIPGVLKFQDTETMKEMTVSIKQSMIAENGGLVDAKYMVYNENRTLYNIFPDLIDALIRLAKTSIETGNPIIWC